MKYLLVIPDGVGIRNFLCSSFIDLLINEGSVTIWHALPKASVEAHRGRWGKEVRWATLPAYREGLAERILRVAKVDAQRRWFYEEDAMDALIRLYKPNGRSPSNWTARALRSAAGVLARVAGSERGTTWLHRRHEEVVRRASYLDRFSSYLQAEQPDVVFCTHQRASRAVPAMVAARTLDIPTATFIYSWDNLPKGRMAVHADNYLVWSDLMKSEMDRYYPDVPQERVHVVGTPQFEPYFDPALVKPRGAFFREIGLDPERPVICFSGDDETTSPYDPMYLADLAEAMRAMSPAARPQILFRRCPTDVGGRFERVLGQYPEIASSEPLWQVGDGDWTQIVPTADDMRLLVNVVTHCDMVVNVASTMAMDFAIFDKPAIYLDYNQRGMNGQWDVHDHYRLPHFRTLQEVQPVHWARSSHDLGSIVTHALAHPKEKTEARRAWLKRQVMQPLNEASARASGVLRQLAEQRAEA